MTASTRHGPDPTAPRASAGGPDIGGLGTLLPTLKAVGPVLLLVGVVAFASHGTSIWTPPRAGGADRVQILAAVAILFGLGVGVGAAITFALHRMAVARGPGSPRLSRTMLRALPITAVACVALSLIAISRVGLGPSAGAGDEAVRASGSSSRQGDPLSIVGWWDTPVKAGEGKQDLNTGDPDSGPPAALPLMLVLIGAAATVVAAGVLWHTRRSGARQDRPGPDEDGGRAVAHGAVMSTIDVMLADPDPQRAIIGAYARLLEGLAACGTARRPYEGPMEHLHRVLTVLHVRPEPLRRLIGLFEIARFSTHPLTSRHREQALDALRDVALDLAATPTPVLGPAPRR